MVHCDATPECRKHLVWKRTGRGKVRSRFCQEHTCQWRISDSQEPLCRTQRKPSEKCCPYHGKCRIQPCTNLAPRTVDANDLPWICPDHGRCKIQPCDHQAPRGVNANGLPWTCPQRKYILSCFRQFYRFVGVRSANLAAFLTQKTSKWRIG